MWNIYIFPMTGILLSTSQDILARINLGSSIFNHEIP